MKKIPVTFFIELGKNDHKINTEAKTQIAKALLAKRARLEALQYPISRAPTGQTNKGGRHRPQTEQWNTTGHA